MSSAGPSLRLVPPDGLRAQDTGRLVWFGVPDQIVVGASGGPLPAEHGHDARDEDPATVRVTDVHLPIDGEVAAGRLPADDVVLPPPETTADPRRHVSPAFVGHGETPGILRIQLLGDTLRVGHLPQLLFLLMR